MLYTKYDKYRFNSNSTFQISDLENPEAIDEYMAGYTELYNMCDRLNCHTIPKPDEMKNNIMQHLNSGTEPAIFINLDLRDFPGFSKKFTLQHKTRLRKCLIIIPITMTQQHNRIIQKVLYWNTKSLCNSL